MVLPAQPWVDPVFAALAGITGAAATVKAMISRNAVGHAQVKATILTVDKHELRIKVLEDTGIAVNGKLDGLIEDGRGRDAKLDRALELGNQTLGEVRAGRSDNRSLRR
jgi:hypothetical protein